MIEAPSNPRKRVPEVRISHPNRLGRSTRRIIVLTACSKTGEVVSR